jgi:acetyl-CoA carboxylase carboxyltransferase component
MDIEEVRAPLTGTIIRVNVSAGDVVSIGSTLCLIESMKLEHPLVAPITGTVTDVTAATGDTVADGDVLITIEPGQTGPPPAVTETSDEAHSTDLTEVEERRRMTRDHARPEAMEPIRARGGLTAREKVNALVDANTFREYGTFTIAAQRARRSLDELITRTPADGLVAGIGSVNGEQFPKESSLVVVMAYDPTVLAGTQGVMNHRKTDRLLAVARSQSLPVVLFADGGGGRPGDTETITKSGLDVPTFAAFARLSGSVPLVAIVSGYCFAGNAILAGMCDVIVATTSAHIGAGGPAMIEGGGLGVVSPDAIGPVDVQGPNGVIDVVVDDDDAAVSVARKYLSYFQGAAPSWSASDQSGLRTAIPQNHRRTYDVRAVISTLADVESVLELRMGFARSLITSLARIEGIPVGIMANDPGNGGGAIDADAGDKGARFLQLCNAFDIPILSLVDTPGIMVGPDAEVDATVRHASRMFVAGANVSVPVMAVVTRRGYGLGAMAMTGAGFKESVFTVAWPSATIGPMGLEGAVRLGYRRELEAISDPAERDRHYEDLVAAAYDDGKALNAATWFDIDEVIDPADTRAWIATILRARGPARNRGRRPYVDTW